MNELVVNWHMTEACNFKCQYCFAKWNHKSQKELLHSAAQTEQLLDEIAKLPAIINAQQQTQFQSIRLNLVGGETFLYPRMMTHIIQAAKQRHFQLSAITNGSLLDDMLLDLIAQHFVMIGFSVDSLNDETNRQIGRVAKNQVVSSDDMFRYIHTLKSSNPKLFIKINTVVNSLNYHEQFTPFIQACQPDKWKIFKMLPIITQNLSISDEQFQYFLNQHQYFQSIISAEDNDEMTQSYVMIDPIGRFFSNQHGINAGYVYSEPIHLIGVEQAMNHLIFKANKFNHRYKTHSLTLS